MTVNKTCLTSSPKHMSDSWIVVDDQDDFEFILIENENDKQELSSQSKRPLEVVNNTSNTCHQPLASVTNHKQHNKKRKWKVLYSLPSTGIQASVNAATLDSYVIDQHEQLFDKRDLFSSQQRFIRVK